MSRIHLAIENEFKMFYKQTKGFYIISTYTDVEFNLWKKTHYKNSMTILVRKIAIQYFPEIIQKLWPWLWFLGQS